MMARLESSCMLLLFTLYTLLLFTEKAHSAYALSSNNVLLKTKLQKCFTPEQVLCLSKDLTIENDPYSIITSTCLIRLSKQLIAIDNQARHKGVTSSQWKRELSTTHASAWNAISSKLIHTMDKGNKIVASAETLESHIQAIKSMSVLSRILPNVLDFWDPCLERFHLYIQHDEVMSLLQPHQLSGIKWAYDCFHLQRQSCKLPTPTQQLYDKLRLPFHIVPSCLTKFTVDQLKAQVNFRVDDIRTTNTNQLVPERRQTAWEGDEGVAPFAYSGKSMETNRWSPLVETARDELVKKTGVYYDGCLLNLYPDGGSGMRYHIDPDQGILWDYKTAVVSVGATRRFSFRAIPGEASPSQLSLPDADLPHTFVLMAGDVTEMFDDCQTRFQHTVRPADEKNEAAARASLVFKKTLS